MPDKLGVAGYPLTLTNERLVGRVWEIITLSAGARLLCPYGETVNKIAANIDRVRRRGHTQRKVRSRALTAAIDANLRIYSMTSIRAPNVSPRNSS